MLTQMLHKARKVKAPKIGTVEQDMRQRRQDNLAVLCQNSPLEYASTCLQCTYSCFFPLMIICLSSTHTETSEATCTPTGSFSVSAWLVLAFWSPLPERPQPNIHNMAKIGIRSKINLLRFLIRPVLSSFLLTAVGQITNRISAKTGHDMPLL